MATIAVHCCVIGPAVLDVHTVRELLVSDPGTDGALGHLSAASGLANHGTRLYVIADDEVHLGVFDVDDAGPGRLFRLFAGELPRKPKARKATKPDFEALMLLPPAPDHTFGCLLALGSGSKPNRQRAVLAPLDEQGLPGGPNLPVDLAPLFEPLRRVFADLNIEGAFVDATDVCLLQRGNKTSRVNACFRFDRRDFERWLHAGAPAPQARDVRRFDLGDIDGVPLCFTDGAALPGGGWVFCAAAEATDDSYDDGRCLGSAVGLVSAGGALLAMEHLALACKTEGIAVNVVAGVAHLLLVTDADDRSSPARLLSARLPLGR